MRSSAFVWSVSSALSVLSAAGVGAQSAPPKDTVRLSEIVVTATKVPTARASIAEAVSVLTADQLAAPGMLTVADALRDLVGATVVQAGSFGSIASLFLRGGESDYAAVLVDGVPVNDPGGAVDLGNITTDNLDRIEIVRGPASVLYGSDAVSGVVQLFTRRGRGPSRVSTALEAGWFDALTPGSVARGRTGSGSSALRWRADAAGGSDEVNYSLAVSRTTSRGLYTAPGFDNGYRSVAASGRVHASPDQRTEADLVFRYDDHTFHYPTDGSGALADANAFDHGTATSIGVDVSRALSSRIEARLLLANHVTDGGLHDDPDGPGDTLGFYAFNSLATVERRRAEARANLRSRAGVLSLGAQVERQSQQSFSESGSSFGSSTDRFDVKRLNHAFYAQLQGDPVGSWSLNGGVRVDDSQTFGTFFTYRGGVVYRAPAGLKLRAVLGAGFKEPTFYENFAVGFARGNPALKPERSTSWELGVEQALIQGRLWWGGTFFAQQFRDLIQFTFAPPSPGGPNYFNAAGAQAFGAEVEGRWHLLGGLDLGASYTYLHTETTDAGFDSGPGATFVQRRRLLRRPTHTLAGNARYTAAAGVRLGVAGRYVGDREDIDYASFQRTILTGYATADASVEFDLLRAAGHTTTLVLRVDNLLDAAYQEAINFPARGRTVWLGGKAAF